MRTPTTLAKTLAFTVALAALASGAVPAEAARKKVTSFWNLTGNTVTSLQLAPAGTDKWGKNLTAGDDDGTVDHDERLDLPQLKAGRYDIRFSDDTGRTCTVRGITVKKGEVFDVHDRDVKDCVQKN